MSGYFMFRREVKAAKLFTPVGYKILLKVLAKGNYKKFMKYLIFSRQERQVKVRLAGSSILFICSI